MKKLHNSRDFIFQMFLGLRAYIDMATSFL